MSDENALPGASGWYEHSANGHSLEGYGPVSVAPGEKLDLHVSTDPPALYRVALYRLGWYGGAGARLILCEPSCAGGELGAAQPISAPNPGTGELNANWPVTDSITVGDWPTGVYIAKLSLTTAPNKGQSANVPFVVRSEPRTPSSRSAILVQLPVNTAEAYNNWGGKSLYQSNSVGGRAVKVSFERPFPAWADGNLNTRYPFTYDYQLIRFLERNGYDVSYTTDVDTDRAPASLLDHHLIIAAGHDEYWTKGIRNAFEAARDQGHNLAFIGANISFWQSRYEDSRETIVEYRSADSDPIGDPALTTVKWRDPLLGRPECMLVGAQYEDGEKGSDAAAIPYAVTRSGAAAPWFAGSRLAAGALLPDLVGYEWDSPVPGCPPGPSSTLLRSTGDAPPAAATCYAAGSGARVFDSGSLQFTWGLDDFDHPAHQSAGLQTATRNIMDALVGPSPPPDGFSLKRRGRNRSKGTARLSIGVPGAGTVGVSGPGIDGRSKTLESPGSVKMVIRARGKLRRRLNRRGKVAVRANVTVILTCSQAVTKIKRITLRKRSATSDR